MLLWPMAFGTNWGWTMEENFISHYICRKNCQGTGFGKTGHHTSRQHQQGYLKVFLNIISLNMIYYVCVGMYFSEQNWTQCVQLTGRECWPKNNKKTLSMFLNSLLLCIFTEPQDRTCVAWSEQQSHLSTEGSLGSPGGPRTSWYGGHHSPILCVKPDLSGSQHRNPTVYWCLEFSHSFRYFIHFSSCIPNTKINFT